jgi:ribosomal protein S18 acetylase RimI-like enzyme
LIRRANKKDIENLLRIEEKCFSAYRFNRRQFHHYISDPFGISAVAEVDGSRVGYISGIVDHRGGMVTARLYSMAVLPRWRKAGIGTALLRHFEKEANKKRCGSVMLEVHKGNKRARLLYEKRGYARREVLSDHYGPGQHGIRMLKYL